MSCLLPARSPSGDLTVSGATTITGPITLLSGLLTMNGGTLSGGVLALGGQLLINSGAVVSTRSLQGVAGYVTLASGGTLSSDVTLTGGTLTINAGASYTVGQITYTGGFGSTVTVYGAFAGSVSVNGGVFQLKPGGSASGAIIGLPGTGTLTIEAPFDGAIQYTPGFEGTAEIKAGGVLSPATTITATQGRLVLEDGSLIRCDGGRTFPPNLRVIGTSTQCFTARQMILTDSMFGLWIDCC